MKAANTLNFGMLRHNITKKILFSRHNAVILFNSVQSDRMPLSG